MEGFGFSGVLILVREYSVSFIEERLLGLYGHRANQRAKHIGNNLQGLSAGISVQVSFSVLWLVLDSLGFGRIKETTLRLP